MSYWRCRATEGSEFWIRCKRLKLLRKAGRLQQIQSSAPSVAQRRQCDIWIRKNIAGCHQTFFFKSLLTTPANFPAHNLNYHWRWWDWIQATFQNLFYFMQEENHLPVYVSWKCLINYYHRSLLKINNPGFSFLFKSGIHWILMNKDDMTVRKSWNEFCDKNPKVCIETTKMIDTLFDVQGQSQYIY